MTASNVAEHVISTYNLEDLEVAAIQPHLRDIQREEEEAK